MHVGTLRGDVAVPAQRGNQRVTHTRRAFIITEKRDQRPCALFSLDVRLSSQGNAPPATNERHALDSVQKSSLLVRRHGAKATALPLVPARAQSAASIYSSQRSQPLLLFFTRLCEYPEQTPCFSNVNSPRRRRRTNGSQQTS